MYDYSELCVGRKLESLPCSPLVPHGSFIVTRSGECGTLSFRDPSTSPCTNDPSLIAPRMSSLQGDRPSHMQFSRVLILSPFSPIPPDISPSSRVDTSEAYRSPLSYPFHTPLHICCQFLNMQTICFSSIHHDFLYIPNRSVSNKIRLNFTITNRTDLQMNHTKPRKPIHKFIKVLASIL